METVVAQLVDRIVQLFARREETNRRLYDDVAAPLMAQMAILHQNYLQTFRGYRDQVIADGDILPALLSRIGADGLFSRDLRTRVAAVTRSAQDAKLESLIRAIRSYLTLATVNPLDEWTNEASFILADAVSNGQDPSVITSDALPLDEIDRELLYELQRSAMLVTTNPGRTYAIRGIERLLKWSSLPKHVMVRLAVRLIESVVIELQRRFAIVEQAHTELRSELLRPV